MQPLVSIIIPTYNRAHLIGETLDSIVGQTYDHWECIVIDDGSTDHTETILKDYCKKDHRFRFYRRPENRPKGANSCRNYGFELSKGEYVNWFDDDDIMLDNFINEKIKDINDKLDIVICSGFYVDSNLENKKQITLQSQSDLFKNYVLWKSHVLTPSILFKKEFLEKKLLFNTKIYRGQETELFSRLFFKIEENNYKILNVPTFLYRQHEDSKTSKNEVFNKKFIDSQTFIAFQNLKKGIELRDYDIINYLSDGLVKFIFRNLENKRFFKGLSISFMLLKLLWLINLFYALKVFLVTVLLVVFRRSSYSLERWLIQSES